MIGADLLQGLLIIALSLLSIALLVFILKFGWQYLVGLAVAILAFYLLKGLYIFLRYVGIQSGIYISNITGAAPPAWYIIIVPICLFVIFAVSVSVGLMEAY